MRAILTVVLIAAPAVAQAPGLHLRFSAAGVGDGDRVHDDRRARTVALWLDAGEPPTPWLGTDEFRAEWRGSIAIERRDRYAFTFVGTGRFALEIDGEVVLESVGAGEPVTSEPVRLSAGAHALLATYVNVRGKPAQVRLEWEGRRFAREPVPPAALTHDPSDPDLVHGLAARHGRMLVATRRCVACHDDPVGHDPLAMPELRMRGPDLAGVGARLEPAWLAAWLRDPRELRPDARMPRLVDDALDATDLAAFLATLTAGPHWQAPGPGDADAGARAFDELGCIACHRIGDEEPDPIARPVDLRGVGAKFLPGALAAFLADPRRHDPWIRMPDLDLSAREAVDLAAFLRSLGSTAGAEPVGDAQRGRALAGELGCASCHAIPGVEPKCAATGLADVLAGPLESGCLGERSERGVPDHGLDATERAALCAFAPAGVAPLQRRSSVEFVQRQLDERRCVACHGLDARTDDWTRRAHHFEAPPADPDDAPVVAQHRPDLTWAGEKLEPGWLEAFVAGREVARPRPWLRARMPAFPELADGLAFGLAAMHGLPPRVPPEPRPERELVAVGRRLVGADGGFACVTCHAVAGEAPLAVFEIQGIDLALSGRRLRREFFQRWMWDPLRIDASSRMPRYADDRGRTAFTDVLGGSARAQFEAIWAYLRSLR